jgi:hypothetical protein
MKDLERKSLSWIIQMGLKSNDTFPYKKYTQKRSWQHNRAQVIYSQPRNTTQKLEGARDLPSRFQRVLALLANICCMGSYPSNHLFPYF